MNSVRVSQKYKKGKSLFATKKIFQGEKIFTVDGIYIKEPTIYSIPIDYNLFIDPAPINNLAMYLCHDCSPNAGIADNINIIAIKDINEGDEVTIDYAMIVYKYGNELPEHKRVCFCMKSTCRGTLGCFDTLPYHLKVLYYPYSSVYLQKRLQSETGLFSSMITRENNQELHKGAIPF